MADQITVTDGAERPNPANARTPAEFVETMRQLKRWTGWGYRRLEKEATAAGHVLPRSTLTTALARNTLPRADLVEAFARACGCDEDQAAEWIAARRRIAASDVPAGSASAGTVSGETRPNTAVAPTRGTPWVRRRVPVRVVSALLTIAIAVAVIAYLRPGSPSVSRPGPDQAAPAWPNPSQPQPSTSTPESSSATTPASQIPVTPAGAVVPQAVPANPVDVPERRAPADSTVVAPTSPVPVESGRETIQLPGEPTIYCPTPYPVTNPYGPIGQCTQRSADQARPGYYSRVTGRFEPITGWMPIVDDSWYDGPVLATDEIRAWARGYATMKTDYGWGVWATQYRDGQARWGVINLGNNRFYPADQGWQPLHP